MSKRLLAIILVLMAVLTLMGPTVSAEYENTYVNTGDMRQDLIGVALTQVGYTEGPNNSTKYGEWMNLPNSPWCGIFVSWCARQAGIPTSVLKNTGIANPNNFGVKYYSLDEYTPRPGDLFFKKNFSHVGIVYTVGTTTFTTIEGNTGNSSSGDGWAVMIQTRKLSDYYYASPNYPTDDYHNYERHYEDKHPHREYYACSDCPSSYYTGKNVFVDTCKQCVQENCSHTYGEWDTTGQTNHVRICTKCEKEESGKHNWKTTQVTKEATCKENGSRDQECSVCKAQRTETIPKTDDHDYSEWELVNDKLHQRICDFCGHKDIEDHELPEDLEVEEDEESPWSTDEKEHWLTCPVCEEDVRKEEHTFGDDCVAPCSVCAYVREEGHFFEEVLEFDEEGHWNKCKQCNEIGSKTPHEFELECSEKCEHCDFTREVKHEFSEELLSDHTGHWYECTVCGLVEGREDHIPGPEATEEAAQLCTLCGWQLAKRIDHVHSFYPIQFEEQIHYGTCRCGQTLGPEPHMWDMATGRCSVCGYGAPVMQTRQKNWDFVWYIGGTVLAIAVVTVIALTTRRKREY